MKKAKLQTGYSARTPEGFQKNIKHMKQEGYSKKRAVGTAYGEADRSFHNKMNGKCSMSFDAFQNMIENQ